MVKMGLPHMSLFAAIVVMLAGCFAAPFQDKVAPETPLSNLDLSSFTQIPGSREIDSGAVPLDLQPATGYDYWELRRLKDPNVIVLAQGGRRGKGELPLDVAAAIERLPKSAGFGAHCLPGWCFDYVVTVSSDGVETLLSAAELRSFLGEIDTRDEAILLAQALGYYSGTSKEEASIREVADGYELLVWKAIQSSEPCPSEDFYRVLLHLSRSGALTEESSEFLERSECRIF